MSDAQLLAGYVDVWWSSVGDLLDVLEQLGPADWARPTDLPGWDVKAVASHIAHLESLLAGGPDEQADIGDPPHVSGPMGQFTEVGVVTRREREPADIIAEIRRCTRQRRDDLAADPPSDAAAPAPGVFGLIGWDQRTLLRNRPLDVWMHEQDVRRAVGLPGGLDAPGADHTIAYLAEGFGFVVGKRVRPPVGTTAVLAIEGSDPIAVVIGDDARAVRLAEAPAAPTVHLALARETFVLRAGGRRPQAGPVEVSGDADLGERILAALATTP